jgi:Domain of unknown function (DUF4164)
MGRPLSPTIRQSLVRLRAAVEALEQAEARRRENQRQTGPIETELALMQDDRARLATELDAALARSNRVEALSEDLTRRVDAAITTVRAVLEKNGAA